MPRSGLLKEIQILQSELEAMANENMDYESMRSWYNRASRVLRKVFGDDSKESKEFLSLKLEPPGSLSELAKQQLDSIHESRPSILSAHKSNPNIESPEGHFYRERLYQLNEYLTLAIVEIKEMES